MSPRVRKYLAEEAAKESVDPSDILSGSSVRAVCRARRRVVVRLHDDKFSYTQIAMWLGMKPNAVAYYMNGMEAPASPALPVRQVYADGSSRLLVG